MVAALWALCFLRELDSMAPPIRNHSALGDLLEATIGFLYPSDPAYLVVRDKYLKEAGVDTSSIPDLLAAIDRVLLISRDLVIYSGTYPGAPRVPATPDEAARQPTRDWLYTLPSSAL